MAPSASRRKRWAGAALGLGAALLCLPLLQTSLFQAFEKRTVDARMRLRGHIGADPRIVVCAIDAKSVDELGQWPWPRSRLAELVDRLREGGARAIAFDVVFSESSRLGQQEDEALAAALERAGNVVLGFYFHAGVEGAANDPPSGLPLPVEVAITPPSGFPEVPAYPAMETSIDLLKRAAPLGGHFLVQPDDDGTVRYYSLVLAHGGTFYPSLALRAVQVFQGAPEISVRPYQDQLPLIRLGELEVPASEKGELWINFLGPFGRTFHYYPIADVLAGRIPGEAFRGKLVLIGATETGIGDIKTSPFDVAVPGVEVHATVADNLLRQRFLRDGAPEVLLGALAILLLGPLCGMAAVTFGRPLVGASCAVFALLLYSAGAHWALVGSSRHVALFLPLLAGAAGYTAAAVWRNVFAEAKAREIRNTFARFVSEAVVEEMLKDPDKVRLGGEKRELTVLFSDIRGFTGLSERLTPEEIVTLLNNYLTPMTRIILERGGTLDKYMGDAIMAFFGAPVSMEDHPERACAAALDMRAKMRELNTQWRKLGLPPLGSGIGINTGPMSVGNMGSDMIFDYTVIGDHVNLGSRLEGLTRIYGVDILTSEHTAERVRGAFCLRELDRVRVKGKKHPVTIFELYGNREDAAAQAGFLETFSTALGAFRSREFTRAEALFREGLSLRPGDGPAELYLSRLAVFNAAPPAEDWEGVTNFVEK